MPTTHHMHGSKIHVIHCRDMMHCICHLSYPTYQLPGGKESFLQQPVLLSRCSLTSLGLTLKTNKQTKNITTKTHTHKKMPEKCFLLSYE